MLRAVVPAGLLEDFFNLEAAPSILGEVDSTASTKRVNAVRASAARWGC